MAGKRVPIRGARVLITGAASGIGRLMAKGAAERGAREVFLWDLNGEAAQALAREIGTNFAGLPSATRASASAIDVTDSAAVTALAKEIGHVDIVINNAGVVTGKPLLEASEAQIRRTFDVNVLAQYWVTRAFLPAMLERDRGAIVNIASAAGLVGVAKQTDYSASKFASFGFTESLRAELSKADSHVHTLVVAPYYIDTGMFDGVRTKFPALLPILKEADVARKILDALESGKHQLVMPPFVKLLPAMRLLPPRAFDAVCNFFGVNTTMDNFVGRKS
ncbi:all-trans-retinol dehydrogenase (NAD+) [Arcanobacterium wilhelmae]|uniref:All-trans-retinol dehydrogenase (NAD+) n=1 Tax=Arcanobacterium wilhelmae TaxID=1803177 RepID=A0ABT9ND62_9ACTO|nr:SDR family oxidoreductase [Arcanobacterium wilhelmae]MDP9801659.1 all-trans-retinol dehydrogenase (NAD+) [Arcanobacterium wilhelmae]WFN90980.1 SDR family oxidoreductase [Arcanobacterium wilhelmae]